MQNWRVMTAGLSHALEPLGVGLPLEESLPDLPEDFPELEWYGLGPLEPLECPLEASGSG